MSCAPTFHLFHHSSQYPLPRHDHSNGEHVIAYELYGKGHQQCTKKSDGTYLMPVGQFAKAYQAQMQIDYNLKGADYEAPDALAYTDCTQFAYNDDTYVSLFLLFFPICVLLVVLPYHFVLTPFPPALITTFNYR